MAILVTGATGFIAQYIIDDLLKENYDVIGTVRSQDKAEKLHRHFGNDPKLSFEIVEDMSSLNAFDAAFEKRANEIRVVLHTASPCSMHVDDYVKDLLIPALHGTQGILNAIKKYGARTVERVVVTSSFAAILDYSKFTNSNAVFTEEDWNPATWEGCQTDGLNAYCASKKFAEEYAWKFVQENKDLVKFKLSTINPTGVFGPQRFDAYVKDHLNASNEMINALIHSQPGITKLDPDFHAEYVDVRDVAKAHLLAFQRGNTAEKRLGLNNGPFSSQAVVDILNSKFPQLKGNIAVGPHPGQPDPTPGCSFDNSQSKKILGFPFIDFEQTVYDTAAQILKKEGRL
ncbi:hypothetical protein BZL39_G02430 [Zygosaccharomyces parabailii]|nr:hypothetical protein BZL39_G02430 [Zygosaccharomyces parabailii]CDH08608.1 probable GRE2-Methylglyoxal reductase (NADPH-dependent) [Zygosaccharomyces bailii ISA1307]